MALVIDPPCGLAYGTQVPDAWRLGRSALTHVSSGVEHGFMSRLARARLVAAGAVFLGLVAGCGDGGRGVSGPAMMGGGATDLHYGRLSCSPPASLPGSVVTVTLADMGMTHMANGTAPLGAHMMLRAAPSTVPSGQVTFVAQNMGWRTHELVILPLSPGSGAGQRLPGADGTVDESGSLGEASASCAAGSGEGITAGSVGWVTLSLPAGRYELLCNLPNHYADGMYQELDITGG